MCNDLLSPAFYNSLLKILQNCTFRINSHPLSVHRRRSGRVVECTGLENRRTLTRTVGSNPTSSAIIIKLYYKNQLLDGFGILWPPKWPLIWLGNSFLH
jgi:hypothetical protein